MSLEFELSHTRQQYRDIFEQARVQLFTLINQGIQDISCTQCVITPEALINDPELCLQPRHSGCGYQAWQKNALNIIENQVAQDILTRLKAIETYKASIQCHSCGVCCKLASSEFSYLELEQRAKQGDRFATEFTSIFLPYPSQEKAKEAYPELVSDVLRLSGDPEGVYFYHCPYIGEDNRCSIYGTSKRPSICSSYPDTPLTFIYDKCAWAPWKQETHQDALMAHATIELCSFVLGKIQDGLK